MWPGFSDPGHAFGAFCRPEGQRDPKRFKPNLFITLMGVTLLFSILNNNGTIELLAKKIVALAGKNNFLIPIAIFLIGFGLTTIGPGPFPFWPLCRPLPFPLPRCTVQPADAGHDWLLRLFWGPDVPHYPGRYPDL